MGMKDNNVPARVRPGRIVAATGMIVLLPALILYIMVAFGFLAGRSASLLLLVVVLAEVGLLAACSLLEEQGQWITKLVQQKWAARLLGWTGHSKK